MNALVGEKAEVTVDLIRVINVDGGALGHSPGIPITSA
jgi:hypothetical protein